LPLALKRSSLSAAAPVAHVAGFARLQALGEGPLAEGAQNVHYLVKVALDQLFEVADAALPPLLDMRRSQTAYAQEHGNRGNKLLLLQCRFGRLDHAGFHFRRVL